MAETQIESAKIHADDDIRFAFNRQRKQLIEEPTELEIIFQRVGNADDRMLSQIECELDSRSSHF